MSQDKTNSPTTQTPVKRDDVQALARGYLGTPWKHQGRNKAVGIDCAGLIVLVAHDLGLSAYDSVDYQRNAHNDAFVRHFGDNMTQKRVADRQIGDVLLFRDRLFSCHSGVVSQKHGVPHIIHAYAPRKAVIEEPLSAEWVSKITYCFEFYGVEK